MQGKKFYAKKENLCIEKRSPMKNLRSYVASPSLRLQNRRHILAVLLFLLSAMPEDFSCVAVQRRKTDCYNLQNKYETRYCKRKACGGEACGLNNR